MKPEAHQIRSVVRNVWSTQLDLAIVDAETVADAAWRGESHTAVIHIGGGFDGGVRLRCSRNLVRRAAAVMFDRSVERLSRDDERDVIGELANVVAGNIKALLPGRNSLSLPIIVEGRDYRISTVDVKWADTYAFELDGEPMTVTVVEHERP
jgi:chemotaxis protein CheX